MSHELISYCMARHLKLPKKLDPHFPLASSRHVDPANGHVCSGVMLEDLECFIKKISENMYVCIKLQNGVLKINVICIEMISSFLSFGIWY